MIQTYTILKLGLCQACGASCLFTVMAAPHPLCQHHWGKQSLVHLPVLDISPGQQTEKHGEEPLSGCKVPVSVTPRDPLLSCQPVLRFCQFVRHIAEFFFFDLWHLTSFTEAWHKWARAHVLHLHEFQALGLFWNFHSCGSEKSYAFVVLWLLLFVEERVQLPAACRTLRGAGSSPVSSIFLSLSSRFFWDWLNVLLLLPPQ